MLSIDTFKNGMGKLQAGFGRRITSESNDYWYELAKELTDGDFHNVIEKLCYGERFPTFAMFREAKKSVVINDGPSHEHQEPKSKCRWCGGGGKLFLDRTDGSGQTFIGRCMGCKLITRTNRMLAPVVPDYPPAGYKLDSFHEMDIKRHDKLKSEGKDPFAKEEVFRGALPEVGTATVPSSSANESQRAFGLKKEKEREMEWQDNYF